MASPRQLRRRLKPHRLQVCPPRGIVRHQDAVLVTEQDAGVLEDASDRWVQLPGDLGFCPPDRPEQRGDLHGSDLVYWSVEQSTGVRRAEVTFPLIADLGIVRFALGIGDDGLRNVPEGRNGPLSLA